MKIMLERASPKTFLYKLRNLLLDHSKTVPEILAPAGGMRQFFAALYSGADAVYLGLKNFNARSRAENFSIDELIQVASVARIYDLKILVTLNILIKENELTDVVRTLAELESSGIYAVIVQDMGLVQIIQKYFPGMRIHASTQMAIHNVAGVQAAADLGIHRAVLARELSAQELKLIRSVVPREKIELEAFCHGSLCYSYSGLCFFSGVGDARSGNRGECAYTCREPYKILNEPGHGFLFSMGDLDTSDSVAKFVDAGIDTLKIEGRKKDSQYVSSVVKLYRHKLNEIFGRSTLRATAPTLVDQELFEKEIKNDLQFSFSRKPTSFFFNGRYHENVIDLNNPGHLGIEVGIISRTFGHSFEMNTRQRIEIHDGLKIVAQKKSAHSTPVDGQNPISDLKDSVFHYKNQNIEASVESLNSAGKHAFQVEPGELVTVKLNHSNENVKVGQSVFKIRSSDLKQRVSKLETSKDRMRSFRSVDLEIQVNAESNYLKVKAQASLNGSEIGCFFDEIPYASSEPHVSNPDFKIKEYIEKNFRIFGDQTIECGRLTFNGNEVCSPLGFKELKIFKKKLGANLDTFLKDRIDSVVQKFLTSTRTMSPNRPQPSIGRSPLLNVKIDRLEYVSALVDFSRNFGILNEVIFEPKRAFTDLRNLEQTALILMEQVGQSWKSLRVSIPAVVRQWDLPVLKKFLSVFFSNGVRKFEIANLGGVQILKSFGFEIKDLDLSADFSCYSLNHSAAQFWQSFGLTSITLSIEDDRSNIRSTLRALDQKGPDIQFIVYKDSPLFIAEACSLTALHNGCPTAAVCGYRTLEIESIKGERYFVAHESCRSIVFGAKPLNLSAHWIDFCSELSINSVRIDFLTKNYENLQIANILKQVVQGKKSELSHAGNFHGRLL